ncbi:MAG: metallophosphoesterase [Bacteroidota bacterium]
MKIIHISDLHFPVTNDKTECLVKGIIEHYREYEIKPVLILTGDILDSPGYSDDVFIKVKNILHELKLDGYKMLICPGNHDVKRNGIKRRRSIPANKKKFNQVFKELLCEGHNYLNPKNDLLSFPLVHKISDVVFIGLDSMSKNQKYAKAARGIIGSRQLIKLKSYIDQARKEHPSCKIVVYLHHNPMGYFIISKLHTWGTKLKDRTSLLNGLKDTDALLFGHIHFDKRYSSKESKYKINCIQLSGGSTHGEDTGWTEIDLIDFSSKNLMINV